MTGGRLAGLVLAYVAAVLGLYVFLVPRLEAAAQALYHNHWVKPRAASKEELLKPSFHLGLYRPELPYHYSKTFEIEDSLGAAVSVISFYQAWGDGKEHTLNRELLENIARGGYVPMITWEPWVSAFDQYRGRMPDSSLARVARGEFDGYIRAWAREAVRFGKPMFLRYAHEFSNPWYAWSEAYGNGPELFIAAWIRVHGIFAAEGARNVAFVWNPYRAADTVYYPGDAYVDWVGLDVFNFGPVIENGFWMDFFSLTHGLYRPLAAFGKPILIAEAGSVSAGGNKAEWYAEMFQSLARGSFPAVKGLVLFDNPAGKAPNGAAVDLSMTSDSASYAAVRSSGATATLGLRPRRKP